MPRLEGPYRESDSSCEGMESAMGLGLVFFLGFFLLIIYGREEGIAAQKAKEVAAASDKQNQEANQNKEDMQNQEAKECRCRDN